MVPAFVLMISMIALRGLGALGAPVFGSWQDCARYGLVTMFLLTASAHFNNMKEDLIKMVPPVFPRPREIVFATGALEIAGAIGLLIPALKACAGIGLTLLMIVMFPANAYSARRGIPLRGKSPTPLWLRLPLHIGFIALTWWSTQPWPVAGITPTEHH